MFKIRIIKKRGNEMKKSIKTLLLALLVCPLLLLSACVPPDTFTITASSSEPAWGRVTGSPNEAVDEGTSLSLGIIETSQEDHPFIGWVKDYEKYVSSEGTLELTANAENAGHYTAVFDEDANSMRFATLTQVFLDSSTYSSATFKINASVSTSGSSNYKAFAEGTLTAGDAFETDLSSIVYFGALGSTREYKFEILLELSNAEGTVSKTIKFSNKLANDTFASTSACEISAMIDENDSVTLSFQKLSKDMYNSGEVEGEE